MSTVKRRITFSAWADMRENDPFDRLAAASTIDNLDDDEIVLEHGGALTAVEVVKRGSGTRPTQLRLMALRDYDSRPSAWGPGHSAQPVTIGQDQYIADITHVAIWSDKVAAHDMYADAPGLTRLSTYLLRRANEAAWFRALYNPRIAERLAELDGVRSLEYGVYAPSKVQAAREQGLFERLLPEWLGPKVPSIRVSVGMGRKSPRDAMLDESLAEEVLAATDHAEQFFDSLHVSGPSKTEKTKTGKPKTVSVNLLTERLHVEKDLDRASGGGNLPDEAAVFGEIDNARAALDETGVLSDAVEARLQMDQQI